jgi:hypothetical protein
VTDAATCAVPTQKVKHVAVFGDHTIMVREDVKGGKENKTALMLSVTLWNHLRKSPPMENTDFLNLL